MIPKLKSTRLNHMRLCAAMLTFFSLSATLPAAQVGTGPVKIFIMIGQSNMLGKGTIAGATTQGTLEYIVANDPGGDYQFLQDGSSNWVVRDDVWIRDQDPVAGGLTVGFGGEAAGLIGPELGFGHHVGDLYEQQVLIVKCAWGGKSLGNDFLPPSSGPYPAPQLAGDPGFYYQEVLRLVGEATTNLGTYFPDYNAAGGYEIAGICWHQGWNDRVTPAFSDAYEVNMANFINDIRSDLETPGLPFVIATTGMDGSPDVYSAVEIAQKKMDNSTGDHPAFAGNVAVVDTRVNYAYDNGMNLEFWQDTFISPASEGYHWNRNAKTYLHIGLAMGDAMSTLSPSRCPARLRAVAGASGGVALNWQNGSDVPTSVEVKRGGVTLAATAPVDPPVFSDPTVAPGLLEYELVFTMPGDPCDPLTVTFDGGIQGLEAFRSGGGVGLTWTNNMAYDAIQVSREGVVIEAALSGSANNYIDASAPTSGLVTYTVVPTTGTSTPASAQINLDAAPAGNVVIYEPFDYSVGGLDGQSGISEVGLEGVWAANSLSLIAANSLTYGTLPVAGNSIGDLSASQNRFGGSRGIRAAALADVGLLDDGQSLWFSVIVGYGTGVNGTNARLAIALANNAFSTANFNFNIPNNGTGSGLGLSLYSGGTVAATQFTDGSSDGFSDNVIGTASDSLFAEDTHGLIVGRIDWGADEDTITLYHPDTDLVFPAAPISTLTVDVDQATYDTITWRRGDVVVMDEIRFGATYDDVIGAPAITDIDPPTPNAAQFQSAPAAENDTVVSMTAVVGTDLSGPVQYLFSETSGKPGATTSGWQTSPSYTDTGLQASTTYTYTVTMRDRRGNTGTASAAADVTTGATDVTAPTPNPMTFDTPPTAISNTEITMTASTASDANYPVQYYFAETSGNTGGSDSGWQDSPTYVDTGLERNTSYSYTVTARDMAPVPNVGTASDPVVVSTLDLDTTPPTPDPATWDVVPTANSDTEVTMTATTASDTSGVEYYFTNLSILDGSHDSGWQDNATYVDTGLTAITSYTYQVQVRDKSINQNEAAVSVARAAVTDPDPAVTTPSLAEGAFYIMGSANAGGTDFDISVVPGAARYSGTGGANGPVYSSFGDGTVLDYRFFQDAGGGAFQAYSFGLSERISDIDPSTSSTGNNSYADVWTSTDPGTDFTANPADFTTNTSARFGNSSVSGTIDISGMTEGIVYFIYGQYRNNFPKIDLIMSGPGQPDVILNDVGDEDQANNYENYLVAVNFQNAGDYNRISYTYTSGNGWITGVVLDGAATPVASTPYDNWSGGSFAGTLTNPSTELDFDLGGLETGIEWVVGGDPTDASDDTAKAPVLDNTNDPDFFIFTYRRTDVASNDPNTTISVGYGSSLTSSGWSTAVDNNDTIEIEETNDHFGAGIDRVVVKFKRTLAVDGKMFARLQVVVTP